MSFRDSAATARAFARTAAARVEDPAILTCAMSGGIVTGNPKQPVSREEVIMAAVGAVKAGASVVHIHARTVAGEMTQATKRPMAISRSTRPFASRSTMSS